MRVNAVDNLMLRTNVLPATKQPLSGLSHSDLEDIRLQLLVWAGRCAGLHHTQCFLGGLCGGGLLHLTMRLVPDSFKYNIVKKRPIAQIEANNILGWIVLV